MDAQSKDIAIINEEPSVNVKETNQKGLHLKILAVMEEVSYLQKDLTLPAGGRKYKAISETKVTTAVRQSLIKHKLTLVPIHQIVSHRGDTSQVEITYCLTDAESGESINVVSTGEGKDSQDKGIGKASTYAYKYALLRTFAIATGEDPDTISNEEIEINERKRHTSLINEVSTSYQKLTQRGYDPMYLTNIASSNVGHVIQSFELLSNTELMNIQALYEPLL